MEDEALYQAFADQINVTCTVLNQIKYNENESFLYIARKLVSIDDWVKIDDLAEELNFSRSALSPVISDITTYFKNHQLTILHKKAKALSWPDWKSISGWPSFSSLDRFIIRPSSSRMIQHITFTFTVIGIYFWQSAGNLKSLFPAAGSILLTLCLSGCLSI